MSNPFQRYGSEAVSNRYQNSGSIPDWRNIRNRKEKYQAYLCSREWGLLREDVHTRANGMCERCETNKGYAVHHLTYRRIYRERLEDLRLLCEDCHEFVHGRGDVDPCAATSPEEVRYKVYFAGEFYKASILSPDFVFERVLNNSTLSADDRNKLRILMINDWRREIYEGFPDFYTDDEVIEVGLDHDKTSYVFEYAGPKVVYGPNNSAQMMYDDTDLVFVWVNSHRAYGESTRAISRAREKQIPLFFGFADKFLREMYSPQESSVVASTALNAWIECLDIIFGIKLSDCK